MDPLDNALVPSVDEKTQIQALDRTQPMLQLKPGQTERRTHDYKRHGTASLYAAFDVATGEMMGRITSPGQGVPGLSLPDRASGPLPTEYPPNSGQLKHSQNREASRLASPATPIPPAPHSYERLLDQRRRKLVFPAGASFHLPELLHQHPAVATGNQKICPSPQSTLSQTLPVASHRRFDLGQGGQSTRNTQYSMLTTWIYRTVY